MKPSESDCNPDLPGILRTELLFPRGRLSNGLGRGSPVYRSVPARCMTGWSCSLSLRREIAEARMRTYLFEVSPPFSIRAFASARERNHSRLRHSSRNLPLKLSATRCLVDHLRAAQSKLLLDRIVHNGQEPGRDS
jgi:hypothetical protein